VAGAPVWADMGEGEASAKKKKKKKRRGGGKKGAVGEGRFLGGPIGQPVKREEKNFFVCPP